MMTGRQRLRSVARCAPLTVFLVGAWELAAVAGACGGRWPHLHEVLWALVANVSTLVVRTTCTLIAVVASLCLGAAVGFALALYLIGGRLRVPGLYSTIAALRPVPVTALLPVFLATFGLLRFAIPLVAFPIAVNLAATLTQAAYQCSRRREGLMRSWGLTGSRYLWHVVRFELLETMFATTRILVPLCFALNIALDYFLYTTNGLGAFVSKAFDDQDFPRMLAGIVLVTVLGMLLSWSIDAVGRRSLKWKRDT